MRQPTVVNSIHLGTWLTNLIAGLLLLLSPIVTHAAPVLIDFNNEALTPSFGGTWNTIPDPFGTTQLVDATNAPSTISLSFSPFWTDDPVPLFPPWSHGNIAWIDEHAASDTFFYNFFDHPGSGTIRIAGLATNRVYRIDLLEAEDFSLPSVGTADFSIFGSFGNSVPNGDNFNVGTDGFLNGNFMTWNAVAPNATGEILIQVFGSDTSTPHMLGAIVNAARITCLQQSAAGVPQEVSCAASVPEPGTIALLALGFAGLAALRRRKIN